MKITILSLSKLTLLRISSLFICGMILASCASLAPLPNSTPTPVPPTETPTSTPVIHWFPPTKTPRQLSAQTLKPTPEYHPGIGSLIFSDSFNQVNLWNTTASPEANALVSEGRLLLSFSGQGPFSVLSLRSQPSLNDFYAEATADVSLCNPNDEYGLIFRAQPGLNFYRFAVNCSGQVRLERSHNGQIYPIQDWLTSGDASLGAPAELTLGVWVVGNEIRTFLNDSFQFSVRDPLFSSGTVGFFVYGSGKTSVTASFSDLLVYSVSYSAPASTAIPTFTRKP